MSQVVSALTSKGSRLGWFTAGATSVFLGFGIIFERTPLYYSLHGKANPITFDTSFVLDPQKKQALKDQLKDHQVRYVEKHDICQLVTATPNEKGDHFKFDLDGNLLSYKILPFKDL